jgi:phospholipase A-2-activating protein
VRSVSFSLSSFTSLHRVLLSSLPLNVRVRIWRDGRCIQTILLPAISVWAVSALENGDLLTGASDGFARVFSRDKRRMADPDVLRVSRVAFACWRL